MERKIKVFGDKAKAIESGQLFQAEIGSVEGHTVVTLSPIEVEEVVQDYGENESDRKRDLD